MTASRDRLSGLDALRGAAALGVLLFHARGLVLPYGLLGHGYLAVDLFFILSGFVLARTHDAALTVGEGVSFLKRRLIRLYPMVLLGLGLGAVIHLAAGVDLPTVGLLLMLGGLFIPFPVTLDVFPLNGPQWSLLWELVANGLYALTARWLTLPCLVLLTLAGAVGHAVLTFGFGTGSIGAFGQDWYGGGPRVVFGFFSGVLLWRLTARGHLDRLPAGVPIGWLIGGVLLTLTLTLPVPESARALHDLAVVLLVYPLVVLLATRARPAAGLWRAGLDRLAGLSYALYALHMPLLWGARFLVSRVWPESVSSPAVGAAAMGLALVLAHLVHRHFEPWAAKTLRPLAGWRSGQSRSTNRPSSQTR
jgi:peptidoglycan/LPS O-acetylase OafA/YrhL